jgi:hypothetical protein
LEVVLQVYSSDRRRRQSSEARQSAFERRLCRWKAALHAVEFPTDMRLELEAMAARHPATGEDLGLLGGSLAPESAAPTPSRAD